MNLFSNRERVDMDGAGYSEQPYVYLDRSARPMAARIRDFLEGAFALVPEEQQLDVRRRFMSRRPDAHLAALLELITLAMLIRIGFNVQLHPEIPGSRHRPDFAVTTPQGLVYVECTTANPSETATAEEQRTYDAIDVLDDIESDRWTVSFASPQVGPQPIVPRRFKRDVEAWLEGLDYDEILAAGERRDVDYQYPCIIWRDAGWVIELSAYPLQLDAPAGVHGIYTSQALNVDTPIRLRGALAGKAEYYGDDLGAPLVVIVAPGVQFADHDHFFEALIGDKQWNISLETRTNRITYLENGVWRSSGGFRRRQLSAAIYAPRLDAWTFADAEWQILYHPSPTYRAPTDLIPFAEGKRWDDEGRNGELIPRGGSFRELFALPEEWPGPEERAR